MFRKLKKRKLGQSTAEYAVLIALVVAAVIAMQTQVKRSLQARMYDATRYLVNQTSNLGSTLEFEPTYLATEFNVTRDTEETTRLGLNEVGMNSTANIVRDTGGFQVFNYTGTVTLP